MNGGPPTNAELKRLRAAVDQAEARYQQGFRARFPVGSDVEWIRLGQARQGGVVLAHGMGRRVRVENTKSHRTFWLDFYHVMRALP